jgi:hypothetical protein
VTIRDELQAVNVLFSPADPGPIPNFPYILAGPWHIPLEVDYPDNATPAWLAGSSTTNLRDALFKFWANPTQQNRTVFEGSIVSPTGDAGADGGDGG